jgi:hypothetical protein
VFRVLAPHAFAAGERIGCQEVPLTSLQVRPVKEHRHSPCPIRTIEAQSSLGRKAQSALHT